MCHIECGRPHSVDHLSTHRLSISTGRVGFEGGGVATSAWADALRFQVGFFQRWVQQDHWTESLIKRVSVNQWIRLDERGGRSNRNGFNDFNGFLHSSSLRS